MISDAYKEALRNKMAELRSKYGFPEKRLRSEENFSQTEQAQLEMRFEEPARLQEALEAAETQALTNQNPSSNNSNNQMGVSISKFTLPHPKPTARIIQLQQASFDLA